MDLNKLLDKINKYFKKEELFAELFLENYEEYNIYFRIDYFKKNKCYRLSWFDLNLMKSYDIEKYISFEYVPNEIIESIKKHYCNIELDNKDYSNNNSNDKVHLYINSKTKKNDYLEIRFNKYIPLEIKEISFIISIMFNTAPRKLQNFLLELHAILNGEENQYNYRSKVNFNLETDDIKTLFQPHIYERGINYLNENRVLFLEKVDTRYFSVVAGMQNVYLCIIDYIEETKELSVHCSCPCDYYCKHLAAVILALKNKKMKRFFKIRYKHPKENILIKYMNFDFLLCIGIVDNKFIVVNNEGNLETIPIFDENNKFNWEILEDSENNDLENQINMILNNN